MTGIRLQALPAAMAPCSRAAEPRWAASCATAAAFGATFWWVLAFAGAMLIPVVFLPGRDRGAGVRESGLQSAEASCEDRRGQSAEASLGNEPGNDAERRDAR